MQSLTVWVDGSSRPDGSGWAVISPSERLVVRGDYPGATNQQAELAAVIQAVYRYGPQITIVTDSMYAIGCFSKWYQRWLKNGWRNAKGDPVENRQLIELGLQHRANEAQYRHVSGHSGDTYNDMADHYAKHSYKRPGDTDWHVVM